MDGFPPPQNGSNLGGRIMVVIASSLYFQSGIRDFTLDMGRNLTGLNDQWAHRFQTIVDEMCNNAIEHGSKPGDEIALTFHLKPGEYLEVVVEDQGSGEKSMNAAELTRLVNEKKAMKNTDIHSLRGRGLSRIVTRWTDELDFADRQPKGIRARARKYFKNIT